MSERGSTQETIQGLLEKWRGQTILVIKEELNNIDQTYLHLSDVRVKEITRDTDDYMDNCLLELIGGGETVEEAGESPLPYGQYDIPLNHIESVNSDGSRLTFKNARATYTLYPI